MHRIIFIACLAIIVASPAFAQHEGIPMPSCLMQNASGLSEVGTGKYQKLGMNIYRATLWAPQGDYDRSKPFALQLHYNRDLSKETLMNAVMDDVRAQGMADDATVKEWKALLAEQMSDVKAGDEIVALNMPGKPAKLFFNSQPVFTIDDKRLAEAFFNIWLGETANQDLKSQLMASN